MLISWWQAVNYQGALAKVSFQYPGSVSEKNVSSISSESLSNVLSCEWIEDGKKVISKWLQNNYLINGSASTDIHDATQPPGWELRQLFGPPLCSKCPFIRLTYLGVPVLGPFPVWVCISAVFCLASINKPTRKKGAAGTGRNLEPLKRPWRSTLGF